MVQGTGSAPLAPSPSKAQSIGFVETPRESQTPGTNLLDPNTMQQPTIVSTKLCPPVAHGHTAGSDRSGSKGSGASTIRRKTELAPSDADNFSDSGTPSLAAPRQDKLFMEASSLYKDLGEKYSPVNLLKGVEGGTRKVASVVNRSKSLASKCACRVDDEKMMNLGMVIAGAGSRG